VPAAQVYVYIVLKLFNIYACENHTHKCVDHTHKCEKHKHECESLTGACDIAVSQQGRLIFDLFLNFK
jgi:hypothetical protein